MKPIQIGNLLWRASPKEPTLAAGEVHVFSFILDQSASQVTKFAQLLSVDEIARADRFKKEDDRRRFIFGRAQLRKILGHYVKSDAVKLEFNYGSHGKPSLQSRSGTERIRFNMTCSQGLGILAVQLDADVGIDVERIRLFPDALKIAQRLFASEEHKVLSSLPDVELEAAFFRYWTQKEAVVKSLGFGLSYPVNAFMVSPNTKGLPEQINVKKGAGNVKRWLILLPEPSPGYVVALATTGPPSLVKCWSWIDR